MPGDWLGYLQTNVRHYALLSEAEQGRLRDDLRVLIDERAWEGRDGLQITDEIKVTIAGQACLLLLNLDHNYFDDVPTIYVYPTAYGQERTELLHGESWKKGPVVLAWDEVKLGGREYQDGRNVVLHEFAHQLDFLDGLADGKPPLNDPELNCRWREVVQAEYDRLVRDSQVGRATLLNKYGATDPSEFFAVATECFFEKPRALLRGHASLYEVLRDYYRQDTAERFARIASK
jgi:Mlc titration factor MtfA (ptsG expression regulator)